LAVLLLTAVIILPAVYYLSSFGWSRIRAGLEWLARRDLLARPDVLALLTGLPLIAGITAIFLLLAPLDRADLWLNLGLWLLHLAAVAALAGTARQLPGSRFQWAMWSFTAVPAGIALAWISFVAGIGPIWRDLALLAAAGGVLAGGIVAWYTVWPANLEASDRLAIAGFFLVGVGNYAVMIWLNNEISWNAALMVIFVFAGLMLMTPLWLNFWQSRFALPWFLLILAAVSLPGLHLFPSLHPLVITLWLYAGLVYLLLSVLAQFGRQAQAARTEPAYQERERLINSFNHFLEALFGSYEAVFGGRRLAAIESEILSRESFMPDDGILDISRQARQALELVVDRLDDLAGTPFTRQAGQAAYDSLSWLEAETLGRHVLAASEWGAGLAQGFIRAQDRRTELIRQADIFAGFDQQAIRETAVAAHTITERKGALLARAGTDAGRFFLIESGEVAVYHDEVQAATLLPGGYFGTNALLGAGAYQFTYRALSLVSLLVINREDFNPLLRADTTLAAQVSSGAAARRMLKQMPLFNSLSPQELAQVDARLGRRHVRANEIIVKQGQARSHLFIVANGQVEVLEDETGRIIGDLGPGEHFGEYALFADVPYSATYRAAVATTLLTLDETRFDEMVAGSDQMSNYVTQIGSGRLIATRRRHGLGAVVS
jgi:CRP-like cAMP-binding protein